MVMPNIFISIELAHIVLLETVGDKEVDSQYEMEDTFHLQLTQHKSSTHVVPRLSIMSTSACLLDTLNEWNCDICLEFVLTLCK